ncbi:unnamed protein product [Adineta ricciae]|uniref:Uncharacterized protein n=1 Tax=Adineta ricciae TaxID=249248 RepID=A0A813T5R7_ADIRI|nr:unnamed protein product [Adineta ricciae]
MDNWQRYFYSLLGMIFVLTFILLFLLIKRHRGHGYFLSKFSAFTRIRFDHLEQRRQTYCPADRTCQCHSSNSASNIQPNFLCPHRSRTLYMSFAGAAMIVGGVRTTEWRGSMHQLHKQSNDTFDALFLTDPAQCFYLQDPNYQWQGISYYRQLVETYMKLYQRVVLIGASLGGSMVCMCADLATVSIAFNPILDPTLLGLPWRIMGAYCPVAQARIIRERVQKTMEKIKTQDTIHNCVLHIHWSQLSAADQRQAHRIVGGGKKKQSRQTECLTSVADFDINNQAMSSPRGVHVWFHQCTRHALAMFLKRSNLLIPLLKNHLQVATDDKSENISYTEERNSSIIEIPMLEEKSNDLRVPLL